MNKILTHPFYKPLLIGVAVLLLAIAIFASSQKALAAGCPTCNTNRGCVKDYQSGANCTANDVSLGIFYVNNVAPVCTTVGGTATAYLTAEIVANASLRYDIGLFVAMDGGSALTASRLANGESCYHDYLNPPLNSTATPAGQPRVSPFYDAEGGGDTCGDAEQGIHNFKVLTPITITCKDDNNDKKVDDISACVSWDNNTSGTCTAANQAYPSTNSKCRCQSVPVELFIRDADVTVDKQAPATIQHGDTFNYTFVIKNNGPDIANNVQFDGADLIADGLQILSTTPVDSNTFPKTPPYCEFTNTGTYQGGSVHCKVGNLALNATYTVVVQVQLDPNYDEATQGNAVANTVCVKSDVEDPVPGNNCDSTSTTTPVSIAYFLASPSGGGTHFEWATATEVGNVGFNLYVKTAKGLVKVNDQLIPSSVVDSLSPVQYSFDAGVGGETFYIEDVDLMTEARLHGPFAAGQAFGGVPQVEAIDWASIHAESDAKNSLRLAEFQTRTSLLGGFAPQALNPAETTLGTSKLYLPSVVKSIQYNFSDYPAFNLSVNADGMYRVTYEMLLAAGLDLNGVRLADIALTNRGVAVPIYVEAPLYFGPGAYIDFYGQALDTLYTDANVYVLSVDPSKAARIAVDATPVDTGATPAAFYMETAAIEQNKNYGYASPNGDPWFDTKMFVDTPQGKSWSFNISVQDYLASATQAYLGIDVWGGTDWPAASPDHHLIAKFNGVTVADRFFNGLTSQVFSDAIPSGTLAEGSNSLVLTLPSDSGVSYEIINLEKYSVIYPRAFIARSDRISFSAAANAFQVDGFSNANILAYRLDGGQPVRLGAVAVNGAYSASFAGSGSTAKYLVSTDGSMLAPKSIAPARAMTDITSGSYNYVMIAHPDFLADSDAGYNTSGLGRLVAAKQAEGYSVKVVNVEDIYAQFGYGVFDPQAIKAYIAHAAQNMGTQYILLVGGDTYDYRNYKGNGSLSFIPSLYIGTGAIVNYAPVDPLYTDLNRDNVPDLAIGRFPVRTSAELASIVDKTLVYASKSYGKTAVMAADQFDGIANYTFSSQSFAQKLGEDWAVVNASIDDLGLSAARTSLIDAMNNGTALVSYVGHSGPISWSLQGLFWASDAAALTNAGKPTVVSQWGCWNTYFVDPASNTLAHKFLLSGDRGAAAVMGATTLTFETSEAKLGNLMMGRLATPGMTIGEAMLAAKHELALQYPGLLDVLLGWTILGDPTLVIQQ